MLPVPGAIEKAMMSASTMPEIIGPRNRDGGQFDGEGRLPQRYDDAERGGWGKEGRPLI